MFLAVYNCLRCGVGGCIVAVGSGCITDVVGSASLTNGKTCEGGYSLGGIVGVGNLCNVGSSDGGVIGAVGAVFHCGRYAEDRAVVLATDFAVLEDNRGCCGFGGNNLDGLDDAAKFAFGREYRGKRVIARSCFGDVFNASGTFMCIIKLYGLVWCRPVKVNKATRRISVVFAFHIVSGQRATVWHGCDFVDLRVADYHMPLFNFDIEIAVRILSAIYKTPV